MLWFSPSRSPPWFNWKSLRFVQWSVLSHQQSNLFQLHAAWWKFDPVKCVHDTCHGSNYQPNYAIFTWTCLKSWTHHALGWFILHRLSHPSLQALHIYLMFEPITRFFVVWPISSIHLTPLNDLSHHIVWPTTHPPYEFSTFNFVNRLCDLVHTIIPSGNLSCPWPMVNIGLWWCIQLSITTSQPDLVPLCSMCLST